MKQRTLSPGVPFYHPKPVDPVVASGASKAAALGLGRDLRVIPVDLIDPNPFAPREVYTPEMIRDRAESLRSGQNDPIHVIESGDRFMIADGWTRVLACREYGVMDSLLAEVHHGMTPQEAAWLGYIQNESREQHCDLDRAMFYERMIKSGMSVNEVATKAGITRQMLAMYRAFSQLPAEIMDIVRLHPKKFGPMAAYHIKRIVDAFGIRKAVSVSIQFVEGERPVRWLMEQIEKPATSKTVNQGSVRQIKFKNGFFRQKGDTFELSVTVPQDRLEAFARGLEELVESVAIYEEEPSQAPDC